MAARYRGFITFKPSTPELRKHDFYTKCRCKTGVVGFCGAIGKMEEVGKTVASLMQPNTALPNLILSIKCRRT